MNHVRGRIIAVTSQWARWHLKSPASRLFSQAFIQAQIKENIKAPRQWPLYKLPVTRKKFPFYDVIMCMLSNTIIGIMVFQKDIFRGWMVVKMLVVSASVELADEK